MRAGALTLPVSDERGVAAISAVWPLPVHASPDATSRALQHCCLSSQVTLYDSLATAARRQAGRRTSKIVSLRVALVSPAGRLKRFRACLRSLRERLIWLTDLLLAVLFTGRVARPGKFKSSPGQHFLRLHLPSKNHMDYYLLLLLMSLAVMPAAGECDGRKSGAGPEAPEEWRAKHSNG